jgi:hypothetical protein
MRREQKKRPARGVNRALYASLAESNRMAGEPSERYTSGEAVLWTHTWADTNWTSNAAYAALACI